MSNVELINELETVYDDSFFKEPSMNQNPQTKIIENTLARIQELFAKKNHEYAGGGDVLGNFRRLAQQQGMPMSTVWAILAGKHIDSIQEYVKDFRADIPRERTQPVADRVDDLIVYALLLQVILEEEQG